MGDTNVLETILSHLRSGGRLWLFLDYDGTLTPIARTPDEARPDAALLRLLADLGQRSGLRVAILSGRPLATLQDFLPVSGLILAGLYGAEVQIEPGTVVRRAPPAECRPIVNQVSSAWAKLIAGCAGFLLEDKGLAVALHARFADPLEADSVLTRAREAALAIVPPAGFRLLGGHRFLEVAPVAAHKGQAVEWLMEQAAFPGALPVYFGDDDKDEEAFAIVRHAKRGGIPVAVGDRFVLTGALVRLSSPEAVRRWLQRFAAET